MMRYILILISVIYSGILVADSYATKTADMRVNIIASTNGSTRFPCTITTKHDLEVPLSGSILKFYQLSGCDGGNGFKQLLLVVVKHHGTWIITDEVEIGSDHTFGMDRIKVENNTLIVSGKTWGEDDSHCCPTVSAERKYKIVNHKLVSTD